MPYKVSAKRHGPIRRPALQGVAFEMKKYLAAVAALFLGVAAAPASAATNLRVNGDFGTGDFTGWSAGGGCAQYYLHIYHEFACGVGSASFFSNHTGAQNSLGGAYAIES
jgi:hypothetical protein